MKITLIGLGVKEDDLSVSALKIILSASKIIVKTKLTQSYNSVKKLNINHTTLDDVYEISRNFESLNKNLAKKVLDESKMTDVCYLVDGSVSDDNSCKIIINKCKNVEIINGVSKTSYILSKANFKNNNYMSISAYEIKNTNCLTFPLIVYDIDNNFVASDVKLTISKFIKEDAIINFINNFEADNIKLFELDRKENYNYTTAIAIEKPILLDKGRYDFYDLIEIVETLRGENGCPWDKAQTKESIRINMIEEVYELIDAIDLNDDDKILEETGDVILQAVFQMIFAKERGAFDFLDSLSNLCEKLIFRHTHIFGKDKALNKEDALNVWEKNKKLEKGHTNYRDTLLDLPKNFPAILRAEKVQKRAAKCGFDFKDYNVALEKVEEEKAELLQALLLNNKKEMENEAGDLIFAVINVVRLMGIESEIALKGSTEKFIKRFVDMEILAEKDNKKLNELNADELDRYYNEAKKN